MLEPGDVVRFFYLWTRQADAGEDSGRKARPACIAVKSSAPSSIAYLFAITSQTPGAERLAAAFSEIECRRAGLSFPSWIILDEYNRVDLERPYDFESMVPLGAVSPSFLRQLAAIIKNAAEKRRIAAVVRR